MLSNPLTNVFAQRRASRGSSFVITTGSVPFTAAMSCETGEGVGVVVVEQQGPQSHHLAHELTTGTQTKVHRADPRRNIEDLHDVGLVGQPGAIPVSMDVVHRG